MRDEERSPYLEPGGGAAAIGGVAEAARYSPTMLPGLVQILDLLAIVGGWLLAMALVPPDPSMGLQVHFTALFFVVLAFRIVILSTDIYEINQIMRPQVVADTIVISISSVVILFTSFIYGLDIQDSISNTWLVTFALTGTAVTIAVRVVFYLVCRYLGRRGVIGKSIAVLGAGPQGKLFLGRFNTAGAYFSKIVGVFDPDGRAGETVEGHPVLGGIDDLLQVARSGAIRDVVVAVPWNADQEIVDTIERLKELPIDVYLGADLVGFQVAFRPVGGLFRNLPMFEVVQRPIAGWSAALKTLEDYVIASAMVIVLSPLLLIIAIAIKLDSPGPVIFRQPRLGFNNRTFSIYKFRSMHHSETPEHVVRQAVKGDPRVTRIGRLIRSTSLDELPQLFNVLDGSMSIVGPRPHAISHNEEYGRLIRGYFARHRVKPGITGLAQVNGLRGETDTLEKMRQRIEHDIYYAENWSVILDIKIILKTAVVVLFQRTAY